MLTYLVLKMPRRDVINIARVKIQSQPEIELEVQGLIIVYLYLSHVEGARAVGC